MPTVELSEATHDRLTATRVELQTLRDGDVDREAVIEQGLDLIDDRLAQIKGGEA